MSQGYYLQGVCLGRTMQEEENVTGVLSVADGLAPFFGDWNQSEKHSQIKPPLGYKIQFIFGP